MWPIGHAAIAYLLYSASTRWRFEESPGPAATVVLGVGSLFPDLVDKPLAWYLGILPTGRSLAHSLLFLIPVVLLIYLIARSRNRAELGVAFGLGAISHALIDALPIIWLDDASIAFLVWPVLSVGGYEEGAPTVLGLLRESMTDPYFLSEFVFLVLALVVWRADGYPGLEIVPGIEDGDPAPER